VVGSEDGGKESSSLPTDHRPLPTSSAARIHLFWQKRIRTGDATTPWWYPSQTGGGELREDRLVFPIPPGVHWRDVLPVVLTDADGQIAEQPQAAEPPKRRRAKVAKAPPILRAPHMKGGLWFAEEGIVVEPLAEPEKKPKPKATIDPRLTAMARELRDRWSERAELILPGPAAHDVRRMIAQEPTAPRALAGPSSNKLPDIAKLPTAA
jgi:hypothetical protein